MNHKVLSLVLMLILSSYSIVTQTCFGFQHNGNAGPSNNYSVIDSRIEGLPLSPALIPPPPQKPGEQTLTFDFVGIYGYLTFPSECHPGDTISYNLIVAAEPEGIHLNFFRLNLSCDSTSGQETIHNETIENKDLPETWVLNETITLDIPADANGKVRCIIDTETYKPCTTTFQSRIEFDTTNIRTLTYEELQTAYENLLSQYNATLEELEHWKTEYQNLNSTYNNLSGLYNATVAELQHWKTEYQNLNSTYNNLLSQHNATLQQLNQWISQFNTLNSTYNELLKNYSSLNSSYQTLQSDYNALKSSYDSLNTSYLSLNSSYNSLQENYNTVLSKYNDLLAKYNSLNSTYQQLNLNYTILVQSNQELTYNLTLLQAKYDNLSTSYNLLNSTYYALLQETENLRTLGRRLWLTIALLITLVAVAIAAAICVVYLIKKKEK
jgi:hypothetical protein